MVLEFNFYYSYLQVCMCGCRYVHMGAGALRGQGH